MNQQNQPWTQQTRQPWNPSAAQQTADQPLSDEELANITSDVLEASHQGMRQVLNDAYLQMGQDQLQIFNLMQQNGWYQTKPAQQPDVQQAKQKYQQMRGTL